MGKWRKAPPALIEKFLAVIPDDPKIEHRKMFGYPAAFINGNLFAGLHQETLMVRLSEADRDRARIDVRAETFEPMPGRAMREYMALPDHVVAEPIELGKWVERSIAYASSLPAKAPKPRRKKKAG
jgi:TfoX/Sxy family transcriptional regulator of competence genes